MSKMITVLLFALIGLSQSAKLTHGRQPEAYFIADMNDVHFLLWTRSNRDDASYYELLLDDTANLKSSPFDVSRPTLVLSHGWNGNGHDDWPVEAKTELLDYFDCNVISIDWGKIADHINYFSVVNNLVDVGHHSANFLDFLHNEAGLDLTSLHMTGHSLGSHLLGFIGSEVANGPIGRITGLDPAGPEYYGATEGSRLDPSDATFVDIIHTNGGPLLNFCAGLKDQIGHVDYYPNGGGHQPGCDDFGGLEELITGGCSHGRSHEFWIESINGATPFTSRRCPDWDTYQAGGCPDCDQGCLDMGFHASTELSGTYYLETKAKTPFAEG